MWGGGGSEGGATLNLTPVKKAGYLLWLKHMPHELKQFRGVVRKTSTLQS